MKMDTPGIYIEETGRGPLPIAGRNIAVAGFAGVTRFAPKDGSPLRLRSYAQYEAAFGAPQVREGRAVDLGLPVRGFFDNGGAACWIAAAPAPDPFPEGGDHPGVLVRGILSAIDALDAIEEIGLLAAPGWWEPAIRARLLDQCSHRRDRLAILDLPAELMSISAAMDQVAAVDSRWAACYHPWPSVRLPKNRQLIKVPPSGIVMGHYARTDQEYGIQKAPAGRNLTGVLAVPTNWKDGKLEDLTMAGINPLRLIPGRGIQIWGARTLSRDPEWRYVPVSRVAQFVETSVRAGTRWAVFEPQGPTLWTSLERQITDFLTGCWQAGMLQGRGIRDAFFVQSPGSVMTPADRAAGRLMLELGIAPQSPAEFILIRISHQVIPDP